MKKRVADYFAESIAKKGVKNVFLLSGGGMMHLLDGLAVNDSLEKVYHHHEQCAGIAAEAYARASGGVAFCYATSGPGALNIVMPVTGAWLDSVPVVFITGQSKVSQTVRGTHSQGLRQFGTFEVDIIALVKSVTKFTWFLDNPADAPAVFEKACEIALSGRPGPVLIDVPVDVQGAFFDDEKVPGYHNLTCRIAPDDATLETILERWQNAKRPVILAGHGARVSSAGEEILALCRKTGTPLVTTQLGKDIVEYDNQYFIGHPGLKGDRAGNIAVQNADFILTLGASLHVFTTGYELEKFAKDACIVQVDLERTILDREQVGVSVKCCADLKSFLQAITNRHEMANFSQAGSMQWREKLLGFKKRFAVSLEAHKTEPGRLNMYSVIDEACRLARGGETIIADAGSAFYTIGQAWRVKKNQRVLISGGLGSMGWALPAATGAAKARSNNPVICITGDGSIQTNVHELAVIAKNKCNIKIVVFNNDGYLSIKNTQDNYFNGLYAGADSASGVFLPSLEKVADTYGLQFTRVSALSDFTAAFEQALSKDGPCIIEALTNIDQEIIPTVSSKKLDDGRMASMPLDNMSPFLDQSVLDEIEQELRA